MTAAKDPDTAASGEPLIAGPQQPPQYVIVLPPYLPRYRYRYHIRRESCLRPLIGFAFFLLFFGAAAYILWPSDPQLSVARIKLDRLNIRTSPQISLDVTLGTMIKVWNRDFYSIDYDSLRVVVEYRGERLGNMTSAGGHIRARGTSYVGGTLLLDGVEMLVDAIFLLEDLAKGAITFDTVSEISGKIGFFFFDLPIKGKISCKIIVNTSNQSISHRNCYPEA